MANFITHLAVSFDDDEEKNLKSGNYQKINVDLNKGSGGKYIYLWYKKIQGASPITRLQITYNNAMAKGLGTVGFNQIKKDLNAGAGGSDVYLWTFNGITEYDIPIQEINVTYNPEGEAGKVREGWERTNCDLNRKAEGSWIYIWMKREKQTYICDVTATDSYGSDSDLLLNGYIRVDEDVNRGAGGNDIFLWYRQTTNSQRALTDLNVSTTDHEYQSLRQGGYQYVSVELNKGAGGADVYMWYKKEAESNPIKSMTLLLDFDAFEKYNNAGTVITRNLNAGTDGKKMYLCYQK